MEHYICRPLEHGRTFTVTVPGSKSITNRALLLGALSGGRTILRGVQFSDDSRVFMQALQDLGVAVEVNETDRTVVIDGDEGRLPEISGEVRVYVGSAGTAARFLTAFLALAGKRCVLVSSEQMKKRPMKPLLMALEQLGAKFEYLEKPYHFPFRISDKKETGIERVDLDIDQSSQFLSALLLSGVLCRDGLTIHLTGKRSARAYVGISMKMMRQFGVRTEELDEDTYRVISGQHYEPGDYQIEPDVSAACYFYAIAAVTGGEAKVRHVYRTMMQGDIRFLEVLEKMGCRIREEQDGIVVAGPSDGRLRGLTVNMSDFSDQTMTLAAIAPFAVGDTVIKGVGHIRLQESDRVRGIVTELGRMGISCEQEEDGIVIHPGKIKPAQIETYEDHRMAMAFSIPGCVVEGIEIKNPNCCRKTFENYFDILTNLHLTNNILNVHV